VELSEVAPPGFGHTKSGKGDKKGGTAAAFDRARKEGRFKGSKSDMFAIMWSQKNKGDKPHYKPGTDKKYKKYQNEEASYKTRDKALKKSKKAMDFRHQNIHKGDGDPDVNESSYEKLKKKIGSKKMHKEPVVVEGIGDAVKKGVKRHKDAVEKKKIKNRKAVPYAALGASYQPEGEVVLEKDLNAAERRALPNKDFVFPGKGEGPKGKQRGAYPIPDKKHARNALAMAAAHASPEKQAKVKAAVAKKFPGIQQEDVVNERYDSTESGAKESHKFHTFYKKAKESKAKQQADATRSDSRKRGIKFGDAKGTGRIRGGKKYYD